MATLPSGQMTQNQSGAVLIVGLIVLLVMTILGVSALQTTVLQEKMTGNLRQTSLAFQAAEAGIQAGLSYIASQSSPPPASSLGNPLVWTACTLKDSTSSCDPDRRNNVIQAWADNPATEKGKSYDDFSDTDITLTPLPRVARPPRIDIEQRFVPVADLASASQGHGTFYYTVTAIGYGESLNAIAILESTVTRQYQ